jgi:hypothetical protein
MSLPGLELWRGPSVIDGSEVAAIVTFVSANAKTGPMAQAWVLCADTAPNDATHTGQDRAVCGDCAFRDGTAGRSCYVATWLGPLNVWKAWQAGDYPVVSEARAHELIADKLRLSAYGDPAAVPFEAWYPAIARADVIGYTHLWRTCDPRFRRICMASVETPEQHAEARAAGWRTYRARLEDEPLLPGEIVCPASHEAGQRVTCAQCMLCRGARSGDAVKSIAILVHGTRARRFIELREGMPRYSASRTTTATTSWKGRRTN